jgi:hypothetical protein
LNRILIETNGESFNRPVTLECLTQSIQTLIVYLIRRYVELFKRYIANDALFNVADILNLVLREIQDPQSPVDLEAVPQLLELHVSKPAV